MDFATLASMIVDIGIIPSLLGAFAYFFFKREKKREEYLAMRDREWKTTLDNCNKAAQDGSQELMKILLAESSRREELMRMESDKREKILRQEADKREAMLMRTIDGIGNSMEKLSDSLGSMSKTLVQIDLRLTNIENGQQRGNGG